MKRILPLILGLILSAGLSAQQFVSTNPQNKVPVLEEFTGVSCPACPSGHAAIETILTNNPDALVVSYQPTNSSLTSPHAGDIDMRRSFPNAFYTEPYYGNVGRSMPSGHVNRRVWSGNRKLSTSGWQSNMETMGNESSPVNVAVRSSYNASSNELSITVQGYTTSSVSNDLKLTVYILEDGLEAEQSGSSANPYVHNHVFRENVSTAQWGDNLTTGATASGQLLTKNYTFDLSQAQDPIDLDNAHILAFITDGTTLEILTGAQTEAKGFGVGIVPNTAVELEIALSPTVASDFLQLQVTSPRQASVTYGIYNTAGQQVYASGNILLAAADRKSLDLTEIVVDLSKGIYLVKVDMDGQSVTERFIKQ